MLKHNLREAFNGLPYHHKPFQETRNIRRAVMKSTCRVFWIALTLAALLAGSLSHAAAPNQKKAKKPKRPPHPAYAPITDNPTLPRVMLIGDSISIGYTIAARKAMAGKANVHRPATNCGDTERGLAELDKWLGDGKWDVIHFNWGLHDLKRMDGKNHQVPIEKYEKNLAQIVKRLKKAGAKLIWCSTTPVPEGCTKPARSDEDALAYNAVAKKIMDENDVAVDDLYAFALKQLDKIQRPANVHFTPEGSAVLAGQVAASIVKALK